MRAIGRRGIATTLACGAALGVAGVAALNAMQDTASAQTSTFTVTPEQLQINQKISQAAVRRSNQSLNYLGPIRTAQTDQADTGKDGVKAGTGTGWGTSQIANGAITADKMSAPTYRATVAADGTLSRGTATSATRTADPGQYQVVFGRDVSQCSYIAQMGATGTTMGPGNIGFAAASATGSNPNAVTVLTWNGSSALANRDFHLAVFC